MKNIIIFAIFVTVISCTNQTSDNSSSNGLATKRPSIKDTLLQQCIHENDTIINEANAVNYVIIDSFYTLKVKIGGLDTLLPYQFDCSVPRGLVPSIHSYYKNTICLMRGHGFDYREFVIGYVNNNQIVLKQYEIGLIADLKNDIVVYRNYNQLEKIIVEDIKKENKKTFIIPSNLATTGISSAAILKGRLQVKFSDGRVTTFALR